MIEILLRGEMVSKKNNWKRGKYGQVYLDKNNQAKIDDFIWQIKSQRIPKIVGNIKAEIYFLIRKDKDIDNMLGSMFDILQEADVIENDRNIFKVIAEKTKTKKEPQTLIKISII